MSGQHLNLGGNQLPAVLECTTDCYNYNCATRAVFFLFSLDLPTYETCTPCSTVRWDIDMWVDSICSLDTEYCGEKGNVDLGGTVSATRKLCTFGFH